MKAIYIRSTRNEPFTHDIILGFKTYETRNRKTLHNCMNEPIYIIETATHAIVASCIIDDCIQVNDIEIFETMRTHTRINTGSKYDLKSGKSKYLYHLSNVQAVNIPIPENVVRHGRSWVEW